MAEREYIEATKIAPHDAASFMKLGNFYTVVNKRDEAEKQFLKGIEIAPKNTNLKIHLGNFYLLEGKKDKAESYFKKALDQDSKNISVIARLADFYITEKKYDEGLKLTEKILKINPKSQDGLLLKGRILLSRNEFDQALNLFQGYVKDNPQSAMAHYLTALAHSGNRNIQQAKAALGEAIKLNPKWEQPRLLMADINFREKILPKPSISLILYSRTTHPTSRHAFFWVMPIYQKEIYPVRPENMMLSSSMRRVIRQAISNRVKFFCIKRTKKLLWNGWKRHYLCSRIMWMRFN
ncbi:MAG: tetratricopeptide repeat protein [Desulfobacterales bacterium]|nr:tetratricopeptide repeat protein [Desulfobacterales bacterium]